MKDFARIVALSIALAGCGRSQYPQPIEDALAMPERNPAQKVQLQVSGTKDPRLVLRFRIDYVTDFAECHVPQWPGRPEHQRMVKHDVAAGAAGASTIEAQVPLDMFRPGTCNWRPARLWLCASTSRTNDPCTGIATFRDAAEPEVLEIARECFSTGDPEVLMCFPPLGDPSTKGSTVLPTSGGKLKVNATLRERKSADGK